MFPWPQKTLVKTIGEMSGNLKIDNFDFQIQY